MHDESPPTDEPRFIPYRPLVAVAVAFASGILAREWGTLPAWGVGAAGVCGILGWAALSLCGARAAALAALYVSLAAAGWVRLDLAVGQMPLHHIARCLGEEPRLVKVRGVVVGDPDVQVLPPTPLSGDSKWLASETRQTRLDLDCLAVEAEGQWRATCGRLRVVDHGPPLGLRHGDRVVAIGTARLPSGPANPGQIDAATLLRRRGIYATMSVSEGALTVEQPGDGRGPRGLLHSARSSIRETLKTRLSSDKRTAGLLCALVLGDRTEIDEELEDAFARTGTIHLLAVSGFNVAVVAWVMWTAAAVAGLRRRLSAMLALSAVVAYALITGAPASVVRAAVMSGAFALSILGRRQMDLVQSVALAAIVLLVARPYDLFNAGFQLSFVAVLGIILLTENLRALLRPRLSLFERAAGDEGVSRWRRFARMAHAGSATAAGATMAAWLAVFPLTAYYFHTFSPITLGVNLLAVPLGGIITVLGFAHLGISTTNHLLAGLTAWPVQRSTSLLLGLVEGADKVPLAWEYCSSPALGWVVGYYALALVFVARRRLGLSAARAASLWVLGGLAYLFLAPSPAAPKGLEVTALDVQHGNATVLRCPDGATVLYDCGTYGRNDVGRWIAAPALWHWGVRTIDLLVVSHADADHVNGIPALLGRFRIGQVIHSPVLERAEAGRQLIAMLDRHRIRHQTARAGDRFRVGSGNIVDVLGPTDWSLRLHPDDQNQNSLVVRVEHAGRRVLLGGDIQQFGTTVLLRSGVDLRADVLLAPHHGCANPLSEELARAVRPAYVLCSNRADHLAPATVAAYEAAGVRVLATCWGGAITVGIREDGSGLEVKGWRARPAARRVTRDP